MLKSSHAQFQITKLIVLVFVAFTHNAFAADDSGKKESAQAMLTLDSITLKQLEEKYITTATKIAFINYLHDLNDGYLTNALTYNGDLRLFYTKNLPLLGSPDNCNAKRAQRDLQSMDVVAKAVKAEADAAGKESAKRPSCCSRFFCCFSRKKSK
jgi:hypothetical protein